MQFDKLARQKQIELPADGRHRWAAVSPDRLEGLTGEKWGWVRNVQDRQQRRTILTLGIDQNLLPGSDPRPIALRTVHYRARDLKDADSVRRRRAVLASQLHMLNRLKSPLLPEPLDWLEIENQSDGFGTQIPRWIVRSEPVLVLDWQRGFTLEYILEKMPDHWHAARVARLARRLLRWLTFLDRNRVAWFNPHPSNILLPKNDVPKLLGLSGLCPLDENGLLDQQHPGFLHTVKGYCPPEFSDQQGGLDVARRSTPMAIGAFGLGVLVAQMAAVQPRLPAEWLQSGTFDVRSAAWRQRLDRIRAPEREALVDLVEKLCDPDPGRRLVDPGEIRAWLDPLAGDLIRYHGVITQWPSRNPRGELFGFIGADPEGGTFPQQSKQLYFKEPWLSAELRGRPQLVGTKVSFVLRVFEDGNEAAQSVTARA
jgi:hypothetical protein